MKRLLGFLLIVTLMASMFVGCGSSDTNTGAVQKVRVWTSDSGARCNKINDCLLE